ncbi:unnamed protein product [Caenorhabditis angaria]|uniref:Uncharacterized protein n=1 Tax=Caenorhabditis angaria TaxID=860376 RepID=A0A9P1IW47_9PELO|nr:unnamed protein product [Caenorhabditis angaria]
MVQFIFYLFLFNLISCFEYFDNINTPTTPTIMVRLMFEENFQVIKNWTISNDYREFGIENGKTMCYANKDTVSISCFCSSQKGEKYCSPFFVLNAIHEWENPDFRIDQLDQSNFVDRDFENSIQKTVINSMKSVIHTFRTYKCFETDNHYTDRNAPCRVKLNYFDSCEHEKQNNLPSTRLINSNSSIRFPRFELLEKGSIFMYLHHPLQDRNNIKTDSYIFPFPGILTHLQFDFTVYPESFECYYDENHKKPCNRSDLMSRYNCALYAHRTKNRRDWEARRTYNRKNEPNYIDIPNWSPDFKVEDLYGLFVFLVMFVIPAIVLVVINFRSVPIDHTPLDPSKFAKDSKIRNRIRQFEESVKTKKSS